MENGEMKWSEKIEDAKTNCFVACCEESTFCSDCTQIYFKCIFFNLLRLLLLSLSIPLLGEGLNVYTNYTGT